MDSRFIPARVVRLVDENGDPVLGSGGFQLVAKSQTAKVLGATGAANDFISSLIIVPETTSPGIVTLLDGSTEYALFAGGATSVADLRPFIVPLGLRSVSGAWKITTGDNVHVLATGKFT